MSKQAMQARLVPIRYDSKSFNSFEPRQTILRWRRRHRPKVPRVNPVQSCSIVLNRAQSCSIVVNRISSFPASPFQPTGKRWPIPLCRPRTTNASRQEIPFPSTGFTLEIPLNSNPAQPFGERSRIDFVAAFTTNRRQFFIHAQWPALCRSPGDPTCPQGHGANGAAAPGTLGAFQPDS